MDFLEICRFVADNSDNTRPTTVYNSDIGSLSRAIRRWRNHVNTAYLMIKSMLGIRNEYVEVEQAFTIPAGSDSTPIPTNILTVLELKTGNDLPMRMLPWPEFERYKSDTFTVSTTGSPDVFSIFGRSLYFFPSPDRAYDGTLRGLANWEELDQDTDVPALGTEYHPVIAEMALFFEMQYENNPQAGSLITSAGGSLSGQGGQAAKAMALFNAVKGTTRKHQEDSPRMISRREMARYNTTRRITRS